MKNNKNLKHRVLRGLRLVAVAGAMAMYSATAMATVANDQLPTGGQFVTGSSGTIMSANGVMTVNQNERNAAIKWDTFNVGANATINFNMKGSQNGTYNILNYSENAGVASEIYGRMKAGADANVWLVNPNGVIMGKGAQIDVGHMHLVAHKLSDDNLAGYANGTINNPSSVGEHTAAELMSMGNMYVNSISFDGNRVVLDADKLYTYAGDKVELGDKGSLGKEDDLVHAFTAAQRDAIIKAGEEEHKTKGEIQANIENAIKDQATVTPVYLGEGTANNTKVYAKKAADASGNAWTGDTLNNDSYLTIGKHAKEVVVGYSVYDANATGANGKGTYENSANWRALYTTLADANGNPKAGQERVGFAWVEDSTQLERIGEGTKTLGRDFALKDGIAAINTKEMNNGKGFQPIGADPTNTQSTHKTAFTGKFDGLNYDIYGLTINRPNEDDIGMFGHVGNGAIIRNVNIVSGAIVGNNKVGGVVGHAVGNVTIENVANSARVLGVENVGGIVGKAEGTSASAAVNIINAENVALIRGNANVGGIVGNGSYVTVTGETFNTGAVKGIVNYQLADSGYNTKSAETLTTATYALDNGAKIGSLVLATNSTQDANKSSYNGTNGYDLSKNEYKEYYIVDINVDQMYFRPVKDDQTLGTEQKGVMTGITKAELKEKLLAGDGARIGARVKVGETVYVVTGMYDGSVIYRAAEGAQNYTLESKQIGKMPTFPSVQDASVNFNIINDNQALSGGGSHDVGGLVGTMTNSVVGNEKGFTIYNDVEVEAGYSLGGIVGSMENSTIQNVMNNGDITAQNFYTDFYEYYYGTGTLQTKAANFADAGGIVGGIKKNRLYRNSNTNEAAKKIFTLGASNTATNTIKDVVNKGDVKTSTEKRTQAAIKVISETTITSSTNPDDYATYDYYNAGNVGGVIGRARNTSIINAKNVENQVIGANNVGGVAGLMEHSTIKDSINDGGRIIGTGAVYGRLNLIYSTEKSNNGVVKLSDVNDSKNGYDITVRELVNPAANKENHIVGNVGGIAGYMFDDDTAGAKRSYIDNARNRGKVSPHDLIRSDESLTYDINAISAVGGIAGKISLQDRGPREQSDVTVVDAWNAIKAGKYQAAISNSSNTGSVSGYFATGGVAGQSYNGEIVKSYNLGNVMASYANISSQGKGALQLGGVLGDGLEQAYYATTILYDVYNAGTIGDPTYTYFGRHVGGVAGRFTGIIDKSYNIGDIYNASDTTGGIVGYLWSNPDSNARGHVVIPGAVYNSFNAGNITVYAKVGCNDGGVDVGGIVGSAGGGNRNTEIKNSYNIGVLRAFADITDGSTKYLTVAGIVSGRSSNVQIENVYTTGEMYSAKYNSNTNKFSEINTGIGAIYGTSSKAGKPSGTGYGFTSYIKNAYYIQPSSSSGFLALNPTDKEITTISYDNRYDISKWVNKPNDNETYYLAGTSYTTTNSFADGIFDGNFRMYLYDEGTGETIRYVDGAYKRTDDTVVTNEYVRATLPVLNVFKPNISKYLHGDNGVIDENLAYVQYGNEYDPLMTFANVNTPVDGLTVNYQNANITGRGGLVVENGGLTINNVDSSKYFSGTFMAKNGDLTINAINGTLNLASDSRFYGKNVIISNPTQDVNINGIVESYGGNITITGKNVEVYGAITAYTNFNDDGTDKTATEFEGVAKTSAGTTLDYFDKDDFKKDVPSKKELYKNSFATDTENNGTIAITATADANGEGGNVGLYLGNNRAGKLSTDGDLTITGKSIYSDIDMKVGVYGKSIFTMKADNIIFDISNMGITAPIKKTDGTEYTDDEKRQITINKMLDDFKSVNTKENKLIFESLTSTSAPADAKIVLNLFNDDDTLNIHKYDDGGNKTVSEKISSLNAINPPKAYAWVSNAKQLKNIQKAYDSANTSDDKAAIMKTNFALKNDIDASELEGYKSIGTGDANGYLGIFDGMGHNLNSLTSNIGGLFDTIGRTTDSVGTVKNININASRLTGSTTRVGLVAGTNKGLVENVQTFGNTIKEATGLNNPTFIGGLVGFNDETGVIYGKSKSEDIVFSESENTQVDVGGIAGLNAGIIHNVTAKSDVSVSDSKANSLGGVVGVNAGLLKDVTSIGVTSGLYEKQGDNLGKVIGADNVGGIAGENRTFYETKDTLSSYANGKPTHAVNYVIDIDANGNYVYNPTTASAQAQTFTGGTVTDAYNDSKVKGWSNTGGVIGRNFGVGDYLETNHSKKNDDAAAAGKVYYVANAADVIAGSNAGGLVGTNNGQVGIGTGNVVVTNDVGNKYTIDTNTGNITSAVDKSGTTISGSDANANEAKAFYAKYIKGSEEEISQIIYGRNSGKITGKYGLEQTIDGTAHISTGSNVGGLMGVSGVKANVENLVNGKAASVYGAVNVGGLIGENQGVLQKSTNMMQNNEIAGAWHVGGIIGKNTGVVVGIENTNKYNITTNKDYVSETDGKLNAKGVAAVNAVIYPKTTDPKLSVGGERAYASYFGGVIGNNGIRYDEDDTSIVKYVGVVGDVINYANVTIDRPAHFVGGVIGRNDGIIAYDGYSVLNPADYSNMTAANIITPKGYLRNNGEVGVIKHGAIVEGGKYIGGIIGENNADIHNTDITNNIGGVVTGDKYVGGIIGRNTANVTGGRDTNDNYYKYDVYSNGKVTGTDYVGGLIGQNDIGTAKTVTVNSAPVVLNALGKGNIMIAYNTGVVSGTNYVGGIVGENAGIVDQVFNSTAAYDKDGHLITTNLGVTGTSNVGGLVGANTGTLQDSYNTGVVSTGDNNGNAVGSNAGTVQRVYATNTSGKLIGSGTTAATDPSKVKNTVSFVTTGDTSANAVLDTDAKRFNEGEFTTALGSSSAAWTFQDGVSTPLLKNFLTKAYFVGDASEVYNGKTQIVFVDKPTEYKYWNGVVYETYFRCDVYVQDKNDNASRKYVGFVYAADEKGDHTIEDFYRTYGLTDNGQQNLIIGNENTDLSGDGKTHVKADNYTLLSSSQINTNYRDNQRVVDGNTVYDVVNPNMLGYEFLQSNKTVTNTNGVVSIPGNPNPPKNPLHPNDPVIVPSSPDNKPIVPGSDYYTSGTITDAPKLVINKRQLTIGVNDVIMGYGSTQDNGDVPIKYYGYTEEGEVEVNYTYKGQKIAYEGVNELYKVVYGGDGLANGESIQSVVGVDLDTLTSDNFNNNGFSSNNRTKSVEYDLDGNPKSGYTLTLDDSVVSTINTTYNSDYDVTVNSVGKVTITPAVLGYQGNVIYRTYGDTTMYEKDAQGNKVNINSVTYNHSALHGNTNGDALETLQDPSNLTIESGSGPIRDGGLDPLDATKTNNVGSYLWGNGSITIVDGVKYGAMNNYRIYDFGKTGTDENPFGLSGAIGGTSIVEPAKVTITVNNTTETYGNTYDHKAQDGFSYVIHNATGTGTANSVTGIDTTGKGLLYETSLGDVISGLGYNNQGFEGNSSTDYTKEVNGSTGYSNTLTFTQGTITPANNYVFEVISGKVTINPRKITANGFTVDTVYGEYYDPTGKDINVGFSGILEKDKDFISIKDITNTKVLDDGDVSHLNFYEAIPSGKETPDVDSYTNSLTTNATIGGGVLGNRSNNYVFVAGNNGTINVTPAELIVTINDGNSVVYGHVEPTTNITTNAVHVNGNPGASNVTIDADKKLVNGDSLSDVITFNIVNGAYDPVRVYGAKTGSKNVGDYKMESDSIVSVGSGTFVAKVDGVVNGTAKNYKVTVIDGNVKVTPRPVVVIPEDKPIPPDNGDPFNPGDDPIEKFNPDVVYVKANDVVRTYGNITKDKEYNVTITGLAPWEDSSKASWNAIGDNGLRDGLLAATATNNAGNHVWDAMVYLNSSISGNYVFDTTNIVKGGSKVNRAELVIKLNDHNVIYGTSENWIKGSYGVHGTPVVVPQDTITVNSNGVTIHSTATNANDVVAFGYNNTGFTNGNTNAVNDPANPYKLQASGVTVNGDNLVAGNTNTVSTTSTNYNIKIVAGNVNIKERPVTIVPGGNDIPDIPTVPPTNIVDTPYDPTHPENYNPNDPTDPRNQVFIKANTVERTYGDATITNNDGKYTVTISGMPYQNGSIKVEVDNVTKDGALTLDSKPNGITNDVGQYTWEGNISNLFDSNFTKPGTVGAASNVDYAELVVKIQDIIGKSGEKFELPYEFDVSGVANRDDYDLIKQAIAALGDKIVNKQADNDDIAIGSAGVHYGDLAFLNFLVEYYKDNDLLKNYRINYQPGNVIITPKDGSHYPEDIYPWLHRTNGDHGWGHQDHERERKAEVRFVDGGADFFNDRKDEKEEGKS